MASSVLTLEQLPEDVLLMVMGFVSVEDILACRLVCKTLCGLALHPDVWRHRSLDDDRPCAGAVLHLAPCLDTLTVTGRVPLAVATTRCAAARLDLHSEPGVAFSIAEYALAVRNQESLGRLRRLELRCPNYRSTTPNPNDVLMRTVASCSGLEWLEIYDELPHGICHPVVHGPPRPSLKYFHCPVTTANSATFVNTILAGHAATLETVDLEMSSHRDLTATADLLAAMPRLRSLRCDAWSVGLEAVAACKTLIDVSISMSKDLDELARVARFMRRAKQLRWFYLEYHEGRLPTEYCTMLAEALASAGGSQLEQLALAGFKDVRPLLRALPMLPALRHLDLCADPDDELLKSITPVTAPALRLLEIGIPLGQCPHAWMHGDAVKATLAENPSLHIQLWCRPLDYQCGTQDCRTCVIGCHREVKWGEVGKIGLYSHDPDMCPSPRDHTADDTSDWQRAFDRSTDVECLWIHM